MSNPVYIVGLDIGTTKIACFVGEKVENGKIVIRGYGKTESTGVKRGMVFNIESHPRSQPEHGCNDGRGAAF